MKNVMGIIYLISFILGIVCIIGSLAVGSTDALIVGLFMLGCGWFGNDIETIKDELELIKMVRQRHRKPEDRQDAPQKAVRHVNNYQITEREPRVRNNY